MHHMAYEEKKDEEAASSTPIPGAEHQHHGETNPESMQHAEHFMHAEHSMHAEHANQPESAPPQHHQMTMAQIHMHDMGGPPRPLWVSIATGVSHCGAGCVLGDLVGEWLVFGTGAMINGKDVWPCLLVDYGFALLFGIFFQYFSIAPMTGEWGFKTIVRAAKADILSLTAFEIGLFGWMVAYQVGIWNYRLQMATWVYWWMMQVGMFLGFFTATPVNWWLITKNIKVSTA